MSSSRSDTGVSNWLEISLLVPDHLSSVLSEMLLALGAVGLAEDHPGLHLENEAEAPIVSGAPGWSPPLPANPGSELLVRSWFAIPGDTDLPDDRFSRPLLRWLNAEGLEEDRLKIALLPDQDWNATWREGFRDFRLSPRVHVVPSWLEPPQLPDEVRVLRLEPDMAFGSGTHFTTAGCASLLDTWMSQRDEPSTTVLDVGTGTGVLALTALLLGASSAVGVDTDPAAVASSTANAVTNGQEERFQALLGDPASAPAGTFDLVAANLLAPVLVELAPMLAARVAEGGRLLISGMLRHQCEATLKSFLCLGLHEVDRREDDEWCAVLLGRIDKERSNGIN